VCEQPETGRAGYAGYEAARSFRRVRCRQAGETPCTVGGYSCCPTWAGKTCTISTGLTSPGTSPNNRAVTDFDGSSCPVSRSAPEQAAHHQLRMVVGPHTISNARQSRSIAEINRRPGPIRICSWKWPIPASLGRNRTTGVRQARFQQSIRQRKKGISSYHRQGVNVAFCDGSIRLLRMPRTPQLVKAMLTSMAASRCPAKD